jgi:uncharacterized protein (DUF1697 family)
MNTSISLLRGINVSGSKIIKMDALRKAFEDCGFKKVQTYIQSGNIIFQHNETTTTELERKIAHKIKDQFGFDVPVLVKTFEALKTVVKNNPFGKNPLKDASFFHVTFLSSVPGKENSKKFTELSFPPEEFILTGNTLYLYMPKGYGNAKLTNNFIESKLKVNATTRNWKTTLELLKMAEATEGKG